MLRQLFPYCGGTTNGISLLDAWQLPGGKTF
jgi:hypothetical protein